MKKLSELKEFETKINQNVEQIDLLIHESISKIRKEYKQNLYDIVLEICINEKLDFEIIKNKYLKPKEVDKKVEEVEEDLLYKIVINDKDYYYEQKEGGIIYNNELKQVGVYKNGSIQFNDT